KQLLVNRRRAQGVPTGRAPRLWLWLQRARGERWWITRVAARRAVGAAGGVYSTPGATPPADPRPHPDCRRRGAAPRQSGRLRPLSRWGGAPRPTHAERRALGLTTAPQPAGPALSPSPP